MLVFQNYFIKLNHYQEQIPIKSVLGRNITNFILEHQCKDPKLASRKNNSVMHKNANI